jgi:hypothetical protein
VKKRAYIFVILLGLAVIWFGAGCRKASRSEGERRAELRWLVATSAGDYSKIGMRDPRWDSIVLKGLTNYAHRFATNSAIYPWRMEMKDAVEAGCGDPLVKILSLRADDGWGNCSTESRMQTWTNAANALEKSGYSSAQKFYGDMGAIVALRSVMGTNAHSLVANYFDMALTRAEEALSDERTPPEMTLRIVTDFLRAMRWSSHGKELVVDMAERALQRSHSGTWQEQHLKGVFEDERAWRARGHGYVGDTSESQWAGYYNHLEKAQKEYMKAWRWDPREETAIRMIDLQLGYQKSEAVMEVWFQRAMNLNPNSYDAVSAKYNYLYPKWHGSWKAQHDFAWNCVESSKWGGHVPLIMLDFHDDYARNLRVNKERYFRQERVFREVQAALDRFFELNPEETGWHHNYFWYAWCAKRWDIAKRELALIEDDINYDYFGGEGKFQQMVKDVKEQAGK